MKKNGIIFCLLTFGALLDSSAQSFKDKLKAKLPKKDKSEIYECGYIHTASFAEKVNPMKALQKGLASGVTNEGNSDLGKAAISVFYQAHLHPQSIMRYPTKTPGWETCGDAVFAGFTNKSGLGLSSTDGDFLVDGIKVEPAGAGTFFYGFKPENRGEKTVKISSSNGDDIEVKVSPAKPLTIKSIDGKVKGEDVYIDGTKDVIIELENGDADPQSKLHIQMVCKLVGTPIMYDVYVTKPSNKIVIPKEAFKNFEGSPSPFIKGNTLIVNRIVEKIVNETDAGALQLINAYMDWMPVEIGGDLSKGNVFTMGFDTTKNTQFTINLETEGEYKFRASKTNPFKSPPVSKMKKIAFASFVVKGNLVDDKISGNYKITKWFPEFSEESWQNLANTMYDQMHQSLSSEMGYEIVSLETVIASNAYKHAKSVKNDVGANELEVGAYGTKRIITSSFEDLKKDMSISFANDFVTERIIQELGVDAVIAVNFDLSFNFETEAVDPNVSIVAFAPNISYKTAAKYFDMEASTTAKSLKDSKSQVGSVEELIYKMLKADDFNLGFIKALKQLSEKESAYPIYENLWKFN